MTSRPATLLRGTIITVDPDRRVVDDGGVVVTGETIRAIGPFSVVRADYPEATIVGDSRDLVVPGFINGHQHLTGDRLLQATIPDDLEPGAAIFEWAVPLHASHTPDDDELSATLALTESLGNGITTTVEAGTVAHPERVAAAARRVGARITLGTWGWDVEEGPFAAPADEVLDRQRMVIERDEGPLVTPWVTLVGHDLMSDALVTGASALAREHDTGLTFHLSPSVSDGEQYLARTGLRPAVHLRQLGVLGPHVLIGHGVHIDDDELEAILETDTAVAACPWAYLRLGQGTTRAFRHLDLWLGGGRLAIGCDTENAGDALDAVRAAALFAGLAKDVPMDPTVFTAHHALELLTRCGAEAIGMGDQIGSIEVGKQADLVVIDRRSPAWVPVSSDPVLQLVWKGVAGSVRDVWIAGKRVITDGSSTRVDIETIAVEAQRAAMSLAERSGVRPAPRWG
ncbi:MAG: amidohydrolase [Acidimicrobiaceae bacterium]|nr:amidohydrolase [Acidimicrobiaceae bacterium]